MVKNKKGFLLAEETLKIILAVIAIGFLAYLLFSLYNSGKKAKNLEFAKESLNFLNQELNAGKENIEIYNPKRWVISLWPGDYKGTKIYFFTNIKTNGIPSSCKNLGWSSCICICKEANPEKCDSEGVCFENKGDFEIQGEDPLFKFIEINPVPLVLKIDYETKQIIKDDGS